MDNLDELTKKIITSKNDKKKLQKLASKITKIPKSINIPSEYFVGKDNE